MEQQAEQHNDRPGGEVRRLARAPGERYTEVATAAAPLPRRLRLLRAVVASAGAAIIVLLLTGIDIGLGLLAVAAGAGWLVGLLLAGGPAGQGADAGSRRAVAAALIAGAGMGAGLWADGVRALTQGGVLAPWAYAPERFGALVLAVPLAAALAGAWRGR